MPYAIRQRLITSTERGSSLVEMLVSLTILSIGVLGLIGTGISVNRFLGQGRWATIAAAESERRIETLRAMARDSAGCASLAGGSSSIPGGLTETWTVSSGISTATVEVIVRGAGSRADTVTAVLPCP